VCIPNATYCGRGRIGNSTLRACVQCKENEYVNEDYTACISQRPNCSSGYYYDTSIEKCQFCPSGTIAKEDQSGCTACPLGKYASINRTICVNAGECGFGTIELDLLQQCQQCKLNEGQLISINRKTCVPIATMCPYHHFGNMTSRQCEFYDFGQITTSENTKVIACNANQFASMDFLTC